MDGVNNSRPAPCRVTLDGLGVLKVGIYARIIIQKPGAQMIRRVRGIACVPGDLPRGCEGRKLNAQAHQGVAVRNEIIRIGHAIAMDVWGAGILRVRPPVIAFGKEVVLSSGAARGRRSGDSERRFVEIFSGGTDNSSAVD